MIDIIYTIDRNLHKSVDFQMKTIKTMKILEMRTKKK